MKHIEFRAWDNLNNKWHPINGFICNNYDGVITGVKIDMDYIYQCILPLTQVEICQYTGLLDKNGKKIFEGDIISYEDTETESVDVGLGCFYEVNVAQRHINSFYTVEYKDGSFGINIKDSELFENGFMSLNQEIIEENKMEIIGNIYENTEFLKP